MARSVRFIPSRTRARFPSAIPRSPSPLRSSSIAGLLLLALFALPAAAQARPFAYVTNNGSATVSQYNVEAGGALMAIAPVGGGEAGSGPEGGAGTADGARDATGSEASDHG